MFKKTSKTAETDLRQTSFLEEPCLGCNYPLDGCVCRPYREFDGMLWRHLGRDLVRTHGRASASVRHLVILVAAILTMTGCTSTLGLYQCRDADTLEYIEATSMEDAIHQFKLAYPQFSKYACKYVDQTQQKGESK